MLVKVHVKKETPKLLGNFYAHGHKSVCYKQLKHPVEWTSLSSVTAKNKTIFGGRKQMRKLFGDCNCCSETCWKWGW